MAEWFFTPLVCLTPHWVEDTGSWRKLWTHDRYMTIASTRETTRMAMTATCRGWRDGCLKASNVAVSLPTETVIEVTAVNNAVSSLKGLVRTGVAAWTPTFVRIVGRHWLGSSGGCNVLLQQGWCFSRRSSHVTKAWKTGSSSRHSGASSGTAGESRAHGTDVKSAAVNSGVWVSSSRPAGLPATRIRGSCCSSAIYIKTLARAFCDDDRRSWVSAVANMYWQQTQGPTCLTRPQLKSTVLFSFFVVNEAWHLALTLLM